MDNEIVKSIEEMYPQCTDELMRNFDKAYDLFCKKQADYGDGNIRLGLITEESSSTSTRTNQNLLLSQFGVVVRMNDKIQRLMNLYSKQLFYANERTNNESIEDTCIDIMNYANILLVLISNKWGK